MQRRLVQSVGLAERPSSIASCAAASAAGPALAPIRVGGSLSPASGQRRAATATASARTNAPARRVGSFQRPGGSIDDLVGRRVRLDPGPQRLARRHVAEAEDEVGSERRRAARGRSGRRRRSSPGAHGRRSAAARSARRGSGSPAALGQRGDAPRPGRARGGGRRRSAPRSAPARRLGERRR